MKSNRLLANLFISLLLTSAVSKAGTNDSTKLKNIFFLHTSYPLPASGITFQRIYSGVLNINAGYHRLLYKKLLGGICANYSMFQTSNKVLDTKTYMKIVSPAISFSMCFSIFKKFVFEPGLNVGYAFISFSGKDADGNQKPKFNEQGAFLQSSFFIGYLLSEKINIGIRGSYQIIFQHFGNNTVLEDNTIRIADFGIGVAYKL